MRASAPTNDSSSATASGACSDDESRHALEDRPQTKLQPLAGRRRPRPVADGPEAPAAFVDDPVPAIRRPRIDADDLHEDTLGTRSDNPLRRSAVASPSRAETADSRAAGPRLRGPGRADRPLERALVPLGAGYDAASHKEYGDFLIDHLRLPHENETPEYYSPPLYYGIAGALTWLGRQAGLGEPHKVAQLWNVPVAVGTVLLVIALARVLGAGAAVARARGRRLRRALAGLHAHRVDDQPRADRPARLRSLPLSRGAHLHGAPLRRCRRDRPRRSRSAPARWCGSSRCGRSRSSCSRSAPRSGRERASGARCCARSRSRSPRASSSQARGTATARRTTRTRSSTGRTSTSRCGSGGRRASTSTRGCPTCSRSRTGSTWRISPGRRRTRTSGATGTASSRGGAPNAMPPPATNGWLVAQNVVGLVPTALALVGWLVLLVGSLRRRDAPWLLVSLLPLAGIAGYLYFTVSFPVPDGDVLKPTYMLSTLGAWAICFAWAASRSPRLVVVALGVLAARRPAVPLLQGRGRLVLGSAGADRTSRRRARRAGSCSERRRPPSRC